MPLWNLVLTGYPSSGKTLLARRVVQDRSNFVRISGDDLRKMFFNEPIPSRDEELLYSMLAIMRDELLRRQYNVIVDTTAPTNRTRSYLMGTKVPNVDGLLIVVVASRISKTTATLPESILSTSISSFDSKTCNFGLFPLRVPIMISSFP